MTPDALAALHARAFTYPRPWSAAEIAALMDSPHVLLLADPAGRGFLMGRVVADEAEVLTIAVAPEARRQGIGADLMARFADAAAARGAVVAHLEVAADNAAAIALYAQAGFAAAGRRRGYFVTPDGARIDALTMTRPLTRRQPPAV